MFVFMLAPIWKIKIVFKNMSTTSFSQLEKLIEIPYLGTF